MIINDGQGNHLFGFYKGTVLKHCGGGRCKIFIPGVYDDKYNNIEKADSLPDAEQVTTLFGGSYNGSGVFSYPNIGSVVICSFFNNDQNYPFFIGSLLVDSLANDQYGIVKSENSDDSVKSGDDARVHRIRVDSAIIEIAESGTITIKSFQDRKNAKQDIEFKKDQNIGSQVQISENGTITLTSSTQVCINTPVVAVNTENYTLNCQTYKVNAGNQIQMTSDSVNIKSKNQMDFTSRTENHINSSFNVTNNGQIRMDANYVQITGSNHPPIFL